MDALNDHAALRVLCLEDSASDAELVHEALVQSGLEVDMDLATDRSRYEELLACDAYDLILADFSLPGFDAHAALALAQAASPSTPFICVSGTIGEEATAELLKQGAADIVLKDRLARLPFAVQRAIGERADRQALRGSEERFRGLVENISDVITSYDLDLRFRYLSPSFTRFMGVDSQTLVGKTHREAGLPEELSDLLDEALRQALESRQAVDLEFMMPMASRETVAEVRIFPEFDADGRPTGVVTVTHDVTARRLAETEVQLARQRLALHVEQTPLAVIEFDLRGRVQEWNPAAAMVFGYPRDEALGRHWSFIVPEAARANVDETWAAIVAQGGGQRSTNDNVTKDGRTVNCEWFNTPLVSPDGQTIGVASLIQDVTERRQGERQLGDTVLRLVAITDGVIAALSRAVEVRDPYTAGHERRVSELATAIAQALGFGGESVQHVQIAGRLHDIGKITIPAEILSKPGRLSETEFSLIKGHPQAAYDILESIEFDFPLADIVVQHHERLDGSGYPAGLAGDAILPEARILAVADVVEAMSSHRPYRAALPLEEALAEIEGGAGVRYDAGACEAATRLFREQGFVFSE